MLKRRITPISLVAGSGFCALLLGAGFSLIQMEGQHPGSGRTPEERLSAAQLSQDPAKSAIAKLALIPASQRVAQLEAIAQDPQAPENAQARYLLATDLLQQQQPEKALIWLQNLEQAYPTLAAYVVLRQAQAYELAGKKAEAQRTWQTLLQRYPQQPVVAEALFALGKQRPQYWDQAIAQFPAHPRSSEIARLRLRQDPNQLAALLLLAQHSFYAPGITALLDRLVTHHALQLRPQDWEAIAFAYWENQEYGKAGLAYAQAPRNSYNLYRAARGLHLGGRGTVAANLYQQLVREFPQAQETPTALMRLAKLAPKPSEAVAYLDLLIKRFPDRAAEGWLAKAGIYQQSKNSKAVAQVRQLLIIRYPKSDAAAEVRWTVARELAARQDFQGAWTWAQPIATHNPQSPVAAEATFWAGKWAERLGRSQEAKTAFRHVLTHHSDSYYAWRSAVLLGANVGDFTTVREFMPQVVQPPQRSPLPIGSPVLRELYQLGQDQEAWKLWQVEFVNPRQPGVMEQFTDGLMRLGVGDNLDGIFMISFLSQREDPQDRAQYQALRQQLVYWQALYPFPYMNSIKAWSQERQINPLLVTALIRQESRFEPGIRSSVGATGLMQVMPETGAWIAQQTKLKTYKLSDPEDSIKLGTWYLDYTHREYDNNSMLAVASYNAGPGNVADWVAKKGVNDLDEFVEAIPFDETRGYVKSVFENYWNYLRLYDPEFAQLLGNPLGR